MEHFGSIASNVKPGLHKSPTVGKPFSVVVEGENYFSIFRYTKDFPQ